MRKSFLNVSLAFALSLLPAGTVFAQGVKSATEALVPKFQQQTPAQRSKGLKDFRNTHPLLARQMYLHRPQNQLPGVQRNVFTVPAKRNAGNILKVNPSTTLWANLALKDGWTQDDNGPFGYYSFSPTDPLTYTLLWQTAAQMPAANGVQYVNGHIYGVYLNLNYASYGYILENLYDTDTSTGQTSNESLDYETDLNLVAIETAQAKDGTVYGEFYNADGSGVELGTVDYPTKTRTTISVPTNFYIVLGITREGQLYGIASDGNLYKIDKSTGAETLVGATGLTLADSEGNFYTQTGEIDQRDNTFYWFGIDNNGNGGLYDVNLETGAATLISSSKDILYGMIITQDAASASAPAKVADAAANFDGASLDGTITFTAPSTTVGGDALTGDLTYAVVANGDTLSQGSATAGEAVTADVSVPESGNYDFEITTKNSEGESPVAKVSKWVGYDVPKPATDVKAVNNNNVVNVSWTAPTEGVHSGVIGDLTYDLLRIANGDTTTVASDIEATTYDDDLSSSQLASYVYAVRAKSHGLSSALATSSNLIVGSAIEPDWTEEFDSKNDFDLFTVLDANNDGRTWRYNDYNHFAYSNYNTSNGNDDWLITPPIHLTPGRLYTVSFKARNGYATYANTFEVKYGNGATPDDLTNTLVETSTPGTSFSNYTAEINPTVDGNYYIGFHDNTAEADHYYVAIDSIVVAKGAVGTAPSAATDFTVTAADRGVLSATLNFTAPTTNINGATIDKIDSIQINRDGVRIGALQNVAAGSQQTFTDGNVPTNGNHTYEIVPYIGADFGQKATATAFIGQDVPAAPQNVALFDNTSNVVATWDPITEVGKKNGYVNPEHVAVSFYKLEQSTYGYSVGDSITSSEKGATRVEIPQNPEETTEADGTTQALYEIAARADGDAGSSTYSVSDPIVVGPSIKLPFKESFNAGTLDNNFAWIDGNDQYLNRTTAAAWQLTKDASVDGDGGSAVWHEYREEGYWDYTDYTIAQGDEVSINSPKISLRGAANPKLFFSVYATANDPAKLEVEVITPDGVKHSTKTIDLSTTATAGWTTQEISLSDYTSERYVIISFKGIADGEDVNVGLDNINVFDQLEYNLSLEKINVPEEVTAGKTGKVDVTVKNIGAHEASNYQVVLFANNEPVDTATVSEPLAILADTTVSLNLPVAINQEGDLNVRAEVVYDNDLDDDDNASQTFTVKVVTSPYTTVNDLQATADADGVDLSWTSPSAQAPETVTEDFESYTPWATQFGDWTLVDGDQGLAGALFSNTQLPNTGDTFAYEIFNPNNLSANFSTYNPGFAAHAGEQYAAAVYQTGADNSGYVDADNWLISPELSGNKQTITFYALNIASQSSASPETFDVLYSTTGKATTDFVKIESDVVDGTVYYGDGDNWKEFTVEVPEGAKYFAIHETTPAADDMIFGLDDITFEKAGGTSDSIVGYNIYRDGKLIGTVKGDVVTFTDADAEDGSHVYNITVLYQGADGTTNESGFSNDATITVTGIDGVVANQEGKFNVFTIDGKTVMLNATSLKGLKSGLYIINDHKYIIK